MSDTTKDKVKKSADRGVVVLSRIPHGFYEEQMMQYFSQFGKIVRLRLSRNPKTGSSRHFAFIEFEDLKTAEIVADTMHNYLLYNHILQCSVLKQDQIHPYLFKNSWKGSLKSFNFAGKHAKTVNTPKTDEQVQFNKARRDLREYERVNKLISLGLLPENAAVSKPSPMPRFPKKVVEEQEEDKTVKTSKVKQITE